MLYRLYHSEDFPQLYAIEQVCFQPPFRFPSRYMRQLVSSPRSATWIAEEDQQMTGFAIAEWSCESEDTFAYIQTVEVLPAHELLRHLEASASDAGANAIWLHVAETNVPAIHLYETHGYIPQGREENYYAPGRHALTYAKHLK
jgi:ribosomal protein S18 acetylase RimI-like enzyme